MRLGPEDKIQVRKIAYLRTNNIPCYHPANESDVPVQYRAKLQAMGVSPGVSDTVIVAPTAQGHPGAVIEVKRDGWRPPKLPDDPRKDTRAQRHWRNQLQWLEHYRAIGWAAEWRVGHRETADQLCAWGYITPAQRDEWISREEHPTAPPSASPRPSAGPRSSPSSRRKSQGRR